MNVLVYRINLSATRICSFLTRSHSCFLDDPFIDRIQGHLTLLIWKAGVRVTAELASNVSWRLFTLPYSLPWSEQLRAAFEYQMHKGAYRKDRILLLEHDTYQIISCNISNWRLNFIFSLESKLINVCTVLWPSKKNTKQEVFITTTMNCKWALDSVSLSFLSKSWLLQNSNYYLSTLK